MMLLEIAWTLPQCFVGFLVAFYYWITGQLVKVEDYKRAQVFYVKKFIKGFNGISLGFFIIYLSVAKNVRHEYGHYKQSLILGWFYLPVVLISYLLQLKTPHHDRWIEKWADRLGK